MVGSMTKIRVALIDTADSHWLPSPREPSGYELFARVPPLPNGAVIPPSAVATPSGAVVAASAATPAAAAAPESAVKSEAAAGGAAASSSSAADPSVDDTAMAEAPAEEGGGVSGKKGDGLGKDGIPEQSPTRSSSRSAAHAARESLAALANPAEAAAKAAEKAAAEAAKSGGNSSDPDARHGSMWIQCSACSKWRRMPTPQQLGSSSSAMSIERWTCSLAEDGKGTGCDAPQERSSHPTIDDRLNLLVDDGDGREKGGRELRPLRPPKSSTRGNNDDDVPRDVFRERMNGKGGKRNRGEDGDTPSGKGPGRPPNSSKPGRISAKEKEKQNYLSNFSNRQSTRIAIHEDGVWRFQPAVGDQYQIEVEPAPTCLTQESCRKRGDVMVWDPDRATAEGINVESYLTSAAKLYSMAMPRGSKGASSSSEGAQAFAAAGISPLKSEIALQMLYSHAFDVLASTHSMATSIGVDKLLEPEAPVAAQTSLVRGKNGLRVALNLTLRHLAHGISEGQPQGSSGPVRSTRSKTVTIEGSSSAGEPWTADEEELLLEGMRRDGKDLATIRKNMLSHRPLPQVVEFFYSKRGQELKFIAMKEREAAERKQQALEEKRQAAAEKARREDMKAERDNDKDSPKKRRKLGEGGPSSSNGPLTGSKPPRPRDSKASKRFGPRVFANVSVRGADAEVRLRLRVKKVDLRRYGEVPGEAEGEDGGTPAASSNRPVKHIAARCRVLGSGKVKLNLTLKTGSNAGRPPRQPRPRRPKVEKPKSDDEEDDDDDGASEMICTWLQCDRCQKWRIVPDNTGGDDNTLWYCEMNPDHRHNRCDVPQQPDDAVVDFTGLLGSSARANRMRDVGEGSSSKDTKHTNGVDGEKEEKERKPTKPPPVPGARARSASGQWQRQLEWEEEGGRSCRGGSCSGGGWRSGRGGRCRTCGGCGRSGVACRSEWSTAAQAEQPRRSACKGAEGRHWAQARPSSCFLRGDRRGACGTDGKARGGGRLCTFTGRPAALCVCCDAARIECGTHAYASRISRTGRLHARSYDEPRRRCRCSRRSRGRRAAC